MNARRAPRRGDDGITLAELIVSITIMSFIVSAITFALVVALKNSRANEDRLDAGGGAQLLAAFFPSDVASSSGDPAFAPSDDPDATTGCTEPDPGGNVVLLHLADIPSDTISYRLVTDGTFSRIVRVVCTGGTARRNTVAFNVSDTASVQADVQRSGITGMVVGVSLSAVVGRDDAVPLSVSGVVRAHSDDRDAPLPCTVATATPYGLVVNAAGRVLADMVFDLYMVGTCGQIALRLPTGGPSGVITIAGRNSVEFWEIPVGPSTATFAPTPGTTTRTATVLSDGVAVATFPFTVTRVPCSVRSISPTSVEFGTDFRFSADTLFTVRTNGPCTAQTPLTIDLPAYGGPPLRKALTETSPGTGDWRATVTAADAVVWGARVDGEVVGVVDGVVDVRVGAAHTLVGQGLLTTTPMPCGVTSVSPLLGKTDISRRLAGNLTLSVQTRGFCTQPEVEIATGGTPDPYAAALGGGPSAWNATVPRPGQTWSEGDHAGLVSDQGRPVPGGAFTFRTVEGCSTVGTPPNVPIAINGAGRVIDPQVLNVTTSGACASVALTLSTGGTPPNANLPLTGPSPWSGTVDAATARWSPGDHTVTITMTDTTGAVTTSGFTITTAQSGCVVTPGSTTTQINVTGSGGPGTRVASGQRITFATNNLCGTAMTLQFTPPGGVAQSVAATSVNGTAWTTANLPTSPAIQWQRNGSTTVSAYTGSSPGPFDQTTLAGEFTVLGV